MKMTPLLILSALIVVAPVAWASSNVDISVKGSITPASCTPSLSGNGAFDFGRKSVREFNSGVETRLVSRSQKLTVHCTGSTRFGLHGIDSRGNASSGLNNSTYGLDFHEGASIGHYTIRTPRSSYLIDSTSGVKSWVSNDGGESWSLGDSDYGVKGSAGFILKESLYSYSFAEQAQPVSMTTFQTDLEIDMRILPTKNLKTGNEIEIAGAATIEIVYL